VWAYSNRSLSKCNERWCNKPNLFVLVHIKPIGLYQIEPVGVGIVHVLSGPISYRISHYLVKEAYSNLIQLIYQTSLLCNIRSPFERYCMLGQLYVTK
jgi:glucose-6-phosphate 1-dehydrogenase